MKYLKTYEDRNRRYKKGDYVLVDVEKIIKKTGNLISDLKQEPTKIIKVYHHHIYSFLVQFDNGDNFNISYDEIIRNLTPIEIKEFELKQDANKYNL